MDLRNSLDRIDLNVYLEPNCNFHWDAGILKDAIISNRCLIRNIYIALDRHLYRL